MSRCAVFRSERMYRVPGTVHVKGYRVFWYQDASGQRHRGFRAKRDFASDVTVLNSTSIVSVVFPPCCVSRQLESAIWGDFTVAFILVLIVKFKSIQKQQTTKRKPIDLT